MPLLKRQANVSMFRGEPVNEIHTTSQAVTVPAETPTFTYYLAGVPTPDAGEPIGTVVVAYTEFDNIKNSGGTMMGSELDSSVAFTGTAFTNERMWPFTPAEGYDEVNSDIRAQQITAGFLPGDYCIDYVNGIFYGVKASTQTGLTALTYKVRQPAASGTFVIPPAIDLTAVGGSAINMGQNVMAGSLPVVIASNQSPIPVISTPVENGTITSDQKVVAVPGTPEALIGAPTAINSVVISALLTNTDSVSIGGSTVDCATNPGNGLFAGSSITIEIDDLSKIYVDAIVAGEGVSFNYLS